MGSHSGRIDPNIDTIPLLLTSSRTPSVLSMTKENLSNDLVSWFSQAAEGRDRRA
jgi:hypothetical protein